MTGTIDTAWLAAHPLPEISPDADKNERGRVLAIGGAEFVPGALRLTGEAALRAGAGKLQIATVRSVAISLGVLVPEAAMIALPAAADGEIAPEAADVLEDVIQRADVTILGPGMSASGNTDLLVARLLEAAPPQQTIILDAAALTCASNLQRRLAASPQSLILTPHQGELALLLGLDADTVAAAPEEAAERAASLFGAVVLLKGPKTYLTAPETPIVRYKDGCIGLATSGSGDVLAGIIGGLCAQGAAPAVAAGWGCFIHGAAGQALSEDLGRVGFLARDILPLVPRLLEAHRHGLPRRR